MSNPMRSPAISKLRAAPRATNEQIIASFGRCLGLGAVLLAGCLGTEGGATCRAPSSECSFGLFHGECPGSDGPVLACSESGGACKWFVGGCPVGYRASDCPADDVCCHATPDGAWPYEEWTPSPYVIWQMRHDLATIGGRVIDDAVPRGIDVSVDPSVEGPDRPEASCSAGAPIQICGSSLVDVSIGFDTDRSSVLTFADRSHDRTAIWVEVMMQGEPRGRAFLHWDEDWAPSMPQPLACRPFRTERIEGTLRISSLEPPSLAPRHGVLDVTIDDVHTVTVRF